jgi:hypothetical protein
MLTYGKGGTRWFPSNNQWVGRSLAALGQVGAVWTVPEPGVGNLHTHKILSHIIFYEPQTFPDSSLPQINCHSINSDIMERHKCVYISNIAHLWHLYLLRKPTDVDVRHSHRLSSVPGCLILSGFVAWLVHTHPPPKPTVPCGLKSLIGLAWSPLLLTKNDRLASGNICNWEEKLSLLNTGIILYTLHWQHSNPKTLFGITWSSVALSGH